MKTQEKKSSLKNPVVHIDPTLDERHKNMKMPTTKLDKLNEEIRSGKFPMHLFNKTR